MNYSIIEPDILKELPHFESFFARIGFKRIDGSVFGLLVLSNKPLTSEEIESVLNLSQSAVSLSLKTLSHYGAIETLVDRDNPGLKAKTHTAKEDSMSIVANVFRKREEEMVRDFKFMAERILAKSQSEIHANRRKKLNSILLTCEIAESVMNFVINIANNKSRFEFESQYDAMIKRLPKALEIIASTSGPLSELTHHLKDNFSSKIINNIKGIYEKRS